jgi:hypothetical protein
VLLLPLGTMMTPRGVPCSFVFNQDAGRKSGGTSFQTSNTSKTNTLLSCRKEGKKEPGTHATTTKTGNESKIDRITSKTISVEQ